MTTIHKITFLTLMASSTAMADVGFAQIRSTIAQAQRDTIALIERMLDARFDQERRLRAQSLQELQNQAIQEAQRIHNSTAAHARAIKGLQQNLRTIDLSSLKKELQDQLQNLRTIGLGSLKKELQGQINDVVRQINLQGDTIAEHQESMDQQLVRIINLEHLKSDVRHMKEDLKAFTQNLEAAHACIQQENRDFYNELHGEQDEDAVPICQKPVYKKTC